MNLKRAREAKQLLRIEAETESRVSLLREARQKEIAQVQAAAAMNRARLKAREAQILADPAFSRVYALLNRPQAPVEERDPSPVPVERSLDSPVLGHPKVDRELVGHPPSRLMAETPEYSEYRACLGTFTRA